MGLMQIFVKLHDGRLHPTVLAVSASVDDLKERMGEHLNVDGSELRFLFDGKELQSGKNLGDYNLQDKCTVMMVMRQEGGRMLS